jgi:hypothetical protein
MLMRRNAPRLQSACRQAGEGNHRIPYDDSSRESQGVHVIEVDHIGEYWAIRRKWRQTYGQSRLNLSLRSVSFASI